MSDPRHEPFEGLAALYAMGALSARERKAFETHLEICLTCVGEVRSLLPVTHGLTHAVPLLDAPPALRARVLQAATGTAPALAPISMALDSPSLDRPFATDLDGTAEPVESARTGLGALFWLAATLLIAAAGAGGWYVAELDRRIEGLRVELDAAGAETERLQLDAAVARALAAERDLVLDIVTRPDLQQITLIGQPLAPRAAARAVWTDTTDMVFLASGLPPLPAGDVYQLWFVLPDAPVSAALLAPEPDGSTTLIVDIPDAVPLPATMAITVEPAGGVPAPTGDVYLLGPPAE